MSSPGPTHSGLVDARAECYTCGWKSYARNSAGNASRHARAQGHTVNVEQTTSTTYNPTTCGSARCQCGLPKS